jgi:hypothetical protein
MPDKQNTLVGDGQDPTAGNTTNPRLRVFQKIPVPLTVAKELGKIKCPKVERDAGTIVHSFMALNFFFN